MLFADIAGSEVLSKNSVCQIISAPIERFTVLATDGLSQHPQIRRNAGSESYRHIEICFVLPEYFDVNIQRWPLTWLEKIAQIPSKFNTSLEPGDTIPAGKPAGVISPIFAANHFIVSQPIELKEFISDRSNQFPMVSVLSVIPIFEQELNFKLRNSGTALLMKLAEKGISDLVDEYRKPVCRKRILGF